MESSESESPTTWAKAFVWLLKTSVELVVVGAPAYILLAAYCMLLVTIMPPATTAGITALSACATVLGCGIWVGTVLLAQRLYGRKLNAALWR